MVYRKRIALITLAIAMVLPNVAVAAETITNEKDKLKLKSGDKYEVIAYLERVNKHNKTISNFVGDNKSSYSHEYMGSTPGTKITKTDNDSENKTIITKVDEMKDYKLLKNKTNANYEIALAYSDGSYSYVESAESLDVAIDKTKAIESLLDDGEIIPSIIGNNGQVVYSTNSMGRVWTHIDGVGMDGINSIAPVYADKDKKKQFTYINQAYVDDVPVIQDTGAMAQVQINGNKGWLVKDTTAKQYDLVMVPINQVKNPSFYYVENGLLYHYISTNMTKDFVSVNDWDVELGIAPTYLKEGTHYLSYDGIYFYDGSNIQQGLESLINDLKVGISKNSINYSEPYYNYYQNLPFRTKTAYTATELNNFIKNIKYTGSTSKLQGIGEALIKAQEQYGVNALITLGVAINESNWGNSTIAKEKNNIFGLKAIDSNPGLAADSYLTVEACIMDFAKNYISRDYADPAGNNFYGGMLGNKDRGANVKYASDPYWGEKAAQYAAKVDYLMGNKIVANMKDYKNYELIKFKDVNEVKAEKSGQLLYSVITNLFDYGTYTETVAAISTQNYIFDDSNNKYIRINPERNSPIKNGDKVIVSDGNYNWSEKALINANNIEVISTSKNNNTIYIKEDITGNGIVDIEDLAMLALKYNKGSATWAGRNAYDLRGDNFIDVYDMVMISKKIK